MDDPVSTESPSPPAATPCSVGRRSVRRRMVQSTLFPHNPQVTEPTGDQRKDSNCSEDEAGDEDAEACGSQKGKRKRKGRGATPQKNSSGKVSCFFP